MQAIEVMEDWGLGCHLSSAVKYLLRAGKKTRNPATDLEKATWYLERARRPSNRELLTSPHARLRIDPQRVRDEFGLGHDIYLAILNINAVAYQSRQRQDMTDQCLERAADAVMRVRRACAGMAQHQESAEV